MRSPDNDRWQFITGRWLHWWIPYIAFVFFFFFFRWVRCWVWRANLFDLKKTVWIAYFGMHKRARCVYWPDENGIRETISNKNEWCWLTTVDDASSRRDVNKCVCTTYVCAHIVNSRLNTICNMARRTINGSMLYPYPCIGYAHRLSVVCRVCRYIYFID